MPVARDIQRCGCKEALMRAMVGDRLHVHGHTVGQRDRNGEILEVRGPEGMPPYLVRFEDGHTGLIFPGPDAEIEQTDQLSGA
jgi:Domain of unknown function (DUF1918)